MTILSRLIAFCLRCALERPLTLGRVDGVAKLDLFLVEVDAIDQRLDGIGAHAAFEVLAVAVLQLAPQHLVFDDLAREQIAELVEGALEDVGLGLVPLADRDEVLLRGALAGPEVRFLRALGLEGLELLLELLLTPGQFELALLVDRFLLADQLGFEVGEIGVPALVVDERHQVGGEVDDLLELLGLQLLTDLGAHEQVGQPRTGAAQVPDVHDRRGQLDVAHPLATHLRARDFDATALADDALEADALVLAAVALPVLRRTEDLLAEEPVLLRLERAVVDGLRLLDLAVRPHADRVGRGQTDPQLIEVVHIEHQ